MTLVLVAAFRSPSRALICSIFYKTLTSRGGNSGSKFHRYSLIRIWTWGIIYISWLEFSSFKFTWPSCCSLPVFALCPIYKTQDFSPASLAFLMLPGVFCSFIEDRLGPGGGVTRRNTQQSRFRYLSSPKTVCLASRPWPPFCLYHPVPHPHSFQLCSSFLWLLFWQNGFLPPCKIGLPAPQADPEASFCPAEGFTAS